MKSIIVVILILLFTAGLGGMIGAFQANGGGNWLMIGVMMFTSYAVGLLISAPRASNEHPKQQTASRVVVVITAIGTALLYGDRGGDWIYFLTDVIADARGVVSDSLWTVHFVLTVAAMADWSFRQGARKANV